MQKIISNTPNFEVQLSKQNGPKKFYKKYSTNSINMKNSTAYKDFFQTYTDSNSEIVNHLRFYHHFMTISIEKYKMDNPTTCTLYETRNALYNIPGDSGTWLNTSDDVFFITPNNLQEQVDSFFNWVINSSIVRCYNATELLLLQAIQYRFFQSCVDPARGKKEMDKVNKEISNSLNNNNITKRNNKHLIIFLQENVSGFKEFFK